jgi:PAS domain S-box-containing protein
MSTTETPAPGGLRNYRIISTPIKADDGSVSAVIEVVEDITNEVTAEQTIRRSEEFVRNIIDSVDEGFIVFDADFRIITCNRTFCIWFGLNREDIQSKNMHDISEQYLCSGNGMEEIRSDVFTTGQSRTTTLKHVLADGSLRHHTIKLFPLKDETGTVTSVIETIQDITEQFLLIEEQQHLMEAAEAANRAKSEFLANMSHEIRTPMNGIMGMSQLLEYTDLTQEQKEYLDAIMISSKNLLQLINDILDLSKIESGTIELEQKSFRLIDCINELIKTQSGIIQAKGLSITAAIQADVPDLVMSDPLRLKQILLNIIGNAIKFSESGNITVSAKVLERHGDISVCVISVSDTGIGISEDNLKRIFAPFIQADASMARKYGGTGLGLAISRRLVELMNGHIDVDSCLGEGTTFSVTIPFLLDPHNLQPDPLTRNTRLQVYSARQLRILVAEDSEINCKVICGFLAKMGIQFECAQDGHEAVEKWRRGNFDLILMDIQMPVMTGEEALTAIRKLESDRGGHIPVVALTAHALNLDRDRLLAFGFDVYLSKPIEFELLMECIEKLV